MLYPKNQTEKLDRELFKNPTCEYRGTPFWAWNTKLDQQLMNKEIDHMKEMGMGGFHMHTRVGLATDYLSDEYMEVVKGCVEKAREDNMLAWLYDEDRWPSGAAGGLVTKQKKYRARFLLFTLHPEHSKTGDLLSKYSVVLDETGCLKDYKRLPKDSETEKANGDIWYAFIEYPEESTWYNNQTYLDTMSPEAVQRFIEVTHERYKEVVGDEFGKLIPAIFTDEPQIQASDTFGFANEKKDVKLPFTQTFARTYKQTYKEDILNKIPELFWNLPNGKISTARYHFYDHVAERFASAFADTIGKWCRENNILMTGHLMAEPTLTSQTKFGGEAMRPYRSFGMSGVDMLCDRHELSTAKQAQSASHQYGQPGVLSELYGVTNWDYDFRGHKLQGDWQAALGISTRVHHLYWVSMEGEAKRDYPAAIGHQSPWYKEYPWVEDHFARVNTVMTRGKPFVRVGVIHPIESCWINLGPREQSQSIIDELEKRFDDIIEWLLFGTMDFDFISESQLPKTYNKDLKGFGVGEMEYDAVIVPACETIRSTTLAALEEFAAKGGKVIFAGQIPEYVDAELSDRAKKIAAECTKVEWSREAVLDSINSLRQIEIINTKGNKASNLIYQMRTDGDMKQVFISHVYPPESKDVVPDEHYNIILTGEYKPSVCDTQTGEIYEIGADYQNGNTVIRWDCSAYSSLLLSLEVGRTEKTAKQEEMQYIEVGELAGKMPITLEEPNVLLLDMAEYSVDGGEWQPCEEILRIDDKARTQLGMKLRGGGWAQPWVTKEKSRPKNNLKLKFTIESDIRVKGAHLALESLEYTKIFLNGRKVNAPADGIYVDDSIKTVPLPDIKPGTNELILDIKFGKLVMVEWCYLLGDFGVEVKGRYSKIVKPVTELAFGDWTTQGLPFYSANLIYHCEIDGGSDTMIEVSNFRAPLVAVELDGKRVGTVAISPYKVELGKLSPGKHRLDLTAYGSRINTFGELHNCNLSVDWFGPNGWRSKGNEWAYEYRLWKSGILIAPKVWKK
ncbi:MAG TPA: hypothetical protein PK629_02465 [Oscillospiraceae bacterium]|nr:hypothetical protein [Oscillospiraceae bacterium]HPF55621.1 hypothetical protein [Clostridiales bacterium]HPK34188.1 hypothetical protein [Oscillospiraceae bacterium]HPR74909.1 hypothetical protein [Oscillospiraceae bacterium]